MTAQRTLKVGMVGVGVGGAGILAPMAAMPQIELVAAADTNPRVRETLTQRYPQVRTYSSAEEICADPDIEVVYIATPNRFHAPQAIMAANHGKHVVVAKPMAITLQEAEAMVEAADRNGVKLISGLSLGSSPTIQTMRRVIDSGELGRVKALNVFAFTDWMLRPRLPDEVDAGMGGGIIFRQAPHQIDSLRVLGGGMVRSVRGKTDQWMPGRMGSAGYYTGYLEFEDGTPATLTYNAYGYFLTAELIEGASLGPRYSPEERLRVRKALKEGTLDHEAAKDSWRIGGEHELGAPAEVAEQARTQRARFLGDLGILIVSCEKGDMRQSPNGLYLYTDEGVKEVEVLDNSASRSLELEELYEAVVHNKPVLHDGAWQMATLEVCLALQQSSQERREIMMTRQVPLKSATTEAAG